jgi:beta-galactosidase
MIVQIPDWSPPPGDDREAYLTVVFRTAADEPWAPAGHEVGWGQLAIRPAAARQRAETAAPVAPVSLDGDGRLIHPLIARPPELSLWRAPTDNDRIGGWAARWIAEGLDRPARRLLKIDRQGGMTVVRAEVALAGGHSVAHDQTFRALSDGGIEVGERVVVPDGLTDIARVGIVLETVPGLESATWFGRGPHESYPDRRRGARVGRWQSSVTDLATPYVKPQENGGRADVRWLELAEPGGQAAGRGLHLTFDRPLQVSATHHRGADLASAGHDIDLVARPETVVHIDAAHRGLGTASCGPDTLPEYLVGPGTYEWTWTIGPAAGAPEAR